MLSHEAEICSNCLDIVSSLKAIQGMPNTGLQPSTMIHTHHFTLHSTALNGTPTATPLHPTPTAAQQLQAQFLELQQSTATLAPAPNASVRFRQLQQIGRNPNCSSSPLTSSSPHFTPPPLQAHELLAQPVYVDYVAYRVERGVHGGAGSGRHRVQVRVGEEDQGEGSGC